MDVQDEACTAVDLVVAGGGDVPEVGDVCRHRTIAPPFSSKDEASLRPRLRGTEEKLIHPLLAVGQPVAHEKDVTHRLADLFRTAVLRLIESVVDRRAAARPPAGIRLDDRRPSSVGEDVVELRDTRPEMIIRVPLDPAQGGWRVHTPEGGRGSITR